VFADEAFAVGGNSYGGYLALALVRTLAPRLRGAALLVPDLPGPDGRRDLPPPVTLEQDRSIFLDLAPDEEWIPEALVVHERRLVEEIRAHDMPGYRGSDPAFLERLERDYLLPEPVRTPGAPFERPSVILAGRQDATVGFRGALGLVDEFPRATVAVVDLAGHHLGRIERPEVFRALTADWLARMEREG
jgi:pimeloyl-ACP methyl ester carboxylesterase